jgi:hypothetical protein
MRLHHTILVALLMAPMLVTGQAISGTDGIVGHTFRPSRKGRTDL